MRQIVKSKFCKSPCFFRRAGLSYIIVDPENRRAAEKTVDILEHPLEKREKNCIISWHSGGRVHIGRIERNVAA